MLKKNITNSHWAGNSRNVYTPVWKNPKRAFVECSMRSALTCVHQYNEVLQAKL